MIQRGILKTRTTRLEYGENAWKIKIKINILLLLVSFYSRDPSFPPIVHFSCIYFFFFAVLYFTNDTPVPDCIVAVVAPLPIVV